MSPWILRKIKDNYFEVMCSPLPLYPYGEKVENMENMENKFFAGKYWEIVKEIQAVQSKHETFEVVS